MRRERGRKKAQEAQEERELSSPGSQGLAWEPFSREAPLRTRVWTFAAQKVRHPKAQAIGLGLESPVFPRPEGPPPNTMATLDPNVVVGPEVCASRPHGFRPFRAGRLLDHENPGLTAWALELRPFGANTKRPILSAKLYFSQRAKPWEKRRG